MPKLLTHYEAGEASAESFESWLTAELGGAAEVARIASYFERHELQQGRPMRLRRMVGYTVVGEMGFYRHVPRTATVIAEEPSVVYRLSRAFFDKMRVQDPAAASAFDNLIIRMLSDRLEFADREISALI